MDTSLPTKNGDSCLYHFIVLYAHASIGGQKSPRGCVHMRVEDLRKLFRLYRQEDLRKLLQRMKDQGLIAEFCFSKNARNNYRTYVDIQLSESYTHYVNRNGHGVKTGGYTLLTMDVVDKIIDMASSVTEMDAYLDLLLHVVVRDKYVEFSEFPVVCFPDSGYNIYPEPRPSKRENENIDKDSPEIICYEPAVQLKYLAKRWKVAKNTVTQRIARLVSTGLLTRVTFKTYTGSHVNLFFAPDAMITGDTQSMDVIGKIDEEFIRFEADHHMEDEDYAAAEYRIKEGTICIMTKENPKGKTEPVKEQEPDVSEDREKAMSDLLTEIEEEQKDDVRTEPLDGYNDRAVIISMSKWEKIQKLIRHLTISAKEKHYRKMGRAARERPSDSG